MTRLPRELRLRDPAAFVATAGGAGLLAGAPRPGGGPAAGGAGGVAAAGVGGGWGIAAAAAVFAAGLWASARYLRHAGEEDPGPIVIDEAAGQLLALAAVPADVWWYAAAFALFRALDIVKPWPVSAVERGFGGALGVMADDVAAGAIAFVLLAAARGAA